MTAETTNFSLETIDAALSAAIPRLGLALAEMAHRIRHAGVGLYAWCAWDLAYLNGGMPLGHLVTVPLPSS